MRAVHTFTIPVLLAGALLVEPLQGQLLGPSFSAGLAVPIRSEADTQESGFHLGGALKLPILPLQLEAALDRMTEQEDAGDDLTILSAGAAIPFSLTPPLVPLGVYLLGGAGVYRVDAAETSTETGISAGGGLSLGVGLRVFVEGRGVLIFGDDKTTYLTAVAGLRF